MSVLGFYHIKHTHHGSDMEKTALLLRGFSFSSSVQHANQAPVRHICADLTDNACLAATVITVAGKTAFWLVYNQRRVAARVQQPF